MQWLIYLRVTAAPPGWFVAMWGAGLEWSNVQSLWMGTILAMKVLLWLHVMLVLWGALWLSMLGKQRRAAAEAQPHAEAAPPAIGHTDVAAHG